MKGSRKAEAPVKLLEWLSNESSDWQPSYPFDCRDVRKSVVSQLWIEQRGLCVYCGRRLNMAKPGETYHVEHFRPQSIYPDRDVDYENLFLSCGLKDGRSRPSDTCGNKKGNWFDEENHIYPSYPQCTQRFKFHLDGFVYPVVDEDQSAINMITQLNLNHSELVKDRKDVFDLLDSGSVDVDDYWLSEMEGAQGFAHMVFQSRKRTLP